ncbi:unnamed protein product [Calicophoron daubneyi]|uniref:NADPH-dependent FMN reductase-like domain-containing protein n=1 Tax=Calicophoron daubneyi TaxID=300641 RepID=A0AAV2TRF0_CALDB
MKAVIFASSIRPGRMNDRVMKLVSTRLKALGHAIRTVDPKCTPLPILKTPLHHYENPTDIPKFLNELNTMVKEADMLLFTTGEYNWCTPSPLVNLLDHLPPQPLLTNRPELLATRPVSGN